MAQHSEPVQGGMSDPMERSAAATTHRPGMVTFAAVIMFMVAGFEVLSAILAFAGTGWWATDSGDLVYANFVFWGIIDLIIALIALYAGIDLLRGGAFGTRNGLRLRRRGRRSGGSSSSRRPRCCGRGHRALRDGHLRARHELRVRRQRLRVLRRRALTNGPVGVTEAGGDSARFGSTEHPSTRPARKE